jgi:predicted AAA+ superfamily ATPase
LLDIPARSLPAYLKALTEVFLVDRLPAWKTNLTARAASKPKVVVSDSGLAAFLNGVDASALELDISSSVVGGIVEGFVVGEILKQRAWSEVDFELSHFREAGAGQGEGREVDLVLENRRRQIVGVEVKATASVSRRHFRGLEWLRDKAGSRFVAGAVIHLGAQARPFGDRLWALPLATLWES